MATRRRRVHKGAELPGLGNALVQGEGVDDADVRLLFRYVLRAMWGQAGKVARIEGVLEVLEVQYRSKRGRAALNCL